MRILLLAGLVFGAASAHAGAFAVDPVRVTLDGDSTAALTIRNDSDVPALIQADMKSWQPAASGDDEYAATDAMLVTPPLFTVPPGGTQVVRVGLRSARPAKVEASYRLFLTEVPPPPPDGFHGLAVALRLAVPIFVAPAAKAAPRLEWRIVARSDAKLTLSVENTGTSHARLTGLAAFDAANVKLGETTLARDVLPNQRRIIELPVKRAPGSGAIRFDVQTDTGRSTTSVSPGPS